MIIQMKDKVDWVLLCQRNQAQINKDNNHKNTEIVEYNYNFCDKVMLNNKSE